MYVKGLQQSSRIDQIDYCKEQLFCQVKVTAFLLP
jgi:hypothetical protein